MQYRFDLSYPAFIPQIPAWLTFPSVGLTVGVLVGMALDRAGFQIAARDGRRTTVTTWLLCGILGVATGLAAAAALEWSPPTIFVGPQAAEVTGTPPQLGLPLIWLSLPLTGLALGLAVSAVVRLGDAVIVRERSTAVRQDQLAN